LKMSPTARQPSSTSVLDSTMTIVSFRRIGRARRVTQREHTRRTNGGQQVGDRISCGIRANRSIVPRLTPWDGENDVCAPGHRPGVPAREGLVLWPGSHRSRVLRRTPMPADPRMLEMLSYYRDAHERRAFGEPAPATKAERRRA